MSDTPEVSTDLPKADLQDIAKELEVPVSGTKQDLVDRIQEAAASEPASEPEQLDHPSQPDLDAVQPGAAEAAEAGEPYPPHDPPADQPHGDDDGATPPQSEVDPAVKDAEQALADAAAADAEALRKAEQEQAERAEQADVPKEEAYSEETVYMAPANGDEGEAFNPEGVVR